MAFLTRSLLYGDNVEIDSVVVRGESGQVFKISRGGVISHLNKGIESFWSLVASMPKIIDEAKSSDQDAGARANTFVKRLTGLVNEETEIAIKRKLVDHESELQRTERSIEVLEQELKEVEQQLEQNDMNRKNVPRRLQLSTAIQTHKMNLFRAKMQAALSKSEIERLNKMMKSKGFDIHVSEQEEELTRNLDQQPAAATKAPP